MVCGDLLNIGAAMKMVIVFCLVNTDAIELSYCVWYIERVGHLRLDELLANAVKY